MFTLGNTFGKKSRPKPDEMIQSTLTATSTGTQANLDRATQAHDAKTAELTADRSRLEELDQIIGVKNADGEDPTAELLERQSVQGRIMQLQNAVAVLLQRKLIAERSLKTAKTQAQRDTLRAMLIELEPVGAEIDQLFERSTRVISDKLGPRLNALRALGDDAINNQIQTASLEFKPRLLSACRAMPGCNNAESWYLRAQKWSASLPKPSDVDQAT